MSSNFQAAARRAQDGPSLRELALASASSHARFSTAMAAVLVAVAYYIGAKLGLALTFQPFPIAVLWPPNALLLAGLLLTPTRIWWILLVAVLPVHLAAELQSGVPAAMALGWFASNCSEAVLGAALIRMLVREPLTLRKFRHAWVFLACGAGIAPLASTFLDVSLVKAIGWGQGEFLELAKLRFMSNSLAAVILVPVVLTWVHGGRRAIQQAVGPRGLEATLLLGAFLVAGIFAFEYADTGSPGVPALLYAPLPFLLWAAVRLGPRSVTTCLFLAFVLVSWGALHGKGPFIDSSPENNALSVQLFLLAIAVPFLLFSAVMEEHKQDKKRVQASQERAMAVFRAGPDSMVIVRLSDGILLDVNDRWEEFFGYSRAEVIGKTTKGLGLYVREETRDTFLRLAREGGVRNFEADMLNRAGELRYTLLSGERVMVGETECLVSVVRDITRQKLAEREAKEQRVELTHLSRVAMLGELSGALAHELNQPLTAILSNAQTAQRLLTRDRIDAPELREILEDIASEDKRAGEVIRRLRAMFKKGEPQFKALEVNDLVNDSLKLAYGNLATRHIQIVTGLCPHALLILGDKVQLQQVLLNIIVNACDAMETPGSTRVLTVETAPTAEDRVQIILTDGGPGVPDSVMARLFDPFFTTKSQGLGLGLSISRSIVAAHGGELLVRNNPGHGATFRVMLPIHQ